MSIDAGQPPDAATLIRARRSDSGGPARLVTGTLIGGRYRIVALVGRGAMGEVYRAEDLELGLTVAMKFVSVRRGSPEHDTFIDEVRIGRLLAHPNICRLYDIADADDRVFITMEFVDGEDLGSLLRRIGRLPVEKAISLSRDLCSGLGAAHDNGIIHRDLKPANVLVDSRGRARLVDFGLARHLGEAARFSRAGTPAYIAPEQLAGEEATAQSDVYALGLILYQIFTGQSARSGSEIKPPSTLVPDIGVAIDRLIMRCLARDPNERPASAIAVLNALPAPDPIQQALDRGETPTPAMVAAAKQRGELAPSTAWLLLLIGIASAVTASLIIVRATPPVLAPDLLAQRSKEIIAATGTSVTVHDSASNYLRGEADGISVFFRSRPTASDDRISYVYRTSPLPLRPARRLVTRNDPPLDVPGMAMVRLSSSGELMELAIVPPAGRLPRQNAVGWQRVLAFTGFAPEGLVPLEPSRYATVAVDEQRAWAVEGLGTRIEAGARGGAVSWLTVASPASSLPAGPADRLDRLMTAISVGTVIMISLAAALLARRNIERRLGDRVAARRIAAAYVLCHASACMLAAYHVASPRAEWLTAIDVLGEALYAGALLWLLYLAAEPFARQRWPRMLISWTRLISGRILDPMVGRDVLVGFAAAGVIVLMATIPTVLPATMSAGEQPFFGSALPMGSVRYALYWLIYPICVALLRACALMAELLLFRSVFGRFAIPLAVLTVMAATADYFSGPALLRFALITLTATLCVFVMFRFGTLAFVAMSYAIDVIAHLPLTLDPSSWYFDQSLFAIALLLTIAFGALVTSVGHRAWLPRLQFE